LIETKYNGEKHKRKIELKSHFDASNEIVNDLKNLNIIKDLDEVENIGYRVVQGGEIFSDTTLITEKEIEQIDELSTLAPLHNPGAVQAMKAFSNIFKNAKATATFDTSFHTTISEENKFYPINYELAKKYKVKKYGMHGTSHKYITHKLEEILNKDKVSFVNLHIGNGASLCAIKDSKSIDTSMGLTPLAGIMMGSRSGDIDPSIHAYICKNANITIEEFDNILNKDSGLKGVSGISSDMRDIIQGIKDGNERAKLAYNIYVNKIVDYTVNYINKVGKPDAIVLTAGVGENLPKLRTDLAAKINIVNLQISEEENNKSFDDYSLISTADSDIPVYIIRTDEELMIAKEAIKIAK